MKIEQGMLAYSNGKIGYTYGYYLKGFRKIHHGKCEAFSPSGDLTARFFNKHGGRIGFSIAKVYY